MKLFYLTGYKSRAQGNAPYFMQYPKKLEFEIHALKNDLSQFAANQLFGNTEALLTKVRQQKTTNIAKEISEIENIIEQNLLPELDKWRNENL